MPNLERAVQRSDMALQLPILLLALLSLVQVHGTRAVWGAPMAGGRCVVLPLVHFDGVHILTRLNAERAGGPLGAGTSREAPPPTLPEG
jgi:hypothetical protein